MSESVLEKSTLQKVTWRLIPFICLLYLMNIIDRANVGFARLQMQEDLNLSVNTFDIGYGVFYVGYLLFEVPSNLLMRKIGARLWIARIMISWGLISSLTMLVWDKWSFYFLRICLGVAEAGFFPGIILYLSYWFPERERAKMTAFFMMAIGLAFVVGNPLSGFIMQYLDNFGGLHGWQWLFLLEGVPSVILGLAVFFYMTDYPRNANWLSVEQKSWLVSEMQQEESRRLQQFDSDRLLAVLQWRVWLLIAIYSTLAIGTNASGAYFPKLIKQQFDHLNTFQIGLLSALPHLCSIGGMILFSVSSDKSNERRIHLVVAALLAVLGWGVAAISYSPLITMLGLCLAQTSMMSMIPVFWALPAAFLTGAALAGGIALINSVANIGGIFAASVLGNYGLWAMVLIHLASVLLLLTVKVIPPRGEFNAAGQASDSNQPV